MKYSFFFIFALLLVSCVDLNNNNTLGILKGKINIGPICPVETNPPQPGCKATLETYKAYQTAVFKDNKKTYILKIEPDIDGNFELQLPDGEYYKHFKEQNVIRIGGSNFPLPFKIIQNQTTNLDIYIDTGIR